MSTSAQDINLPRVRGAGDECDSWTALLSFDGAETTNCCRQEGGSAASSAHEEGCCPKP